MEMTQFQRSWESVICSPKAIEALYHVIRRACEFNSEGCFPIRIREVGISGSSLRTDKVRDIDVIVVYVHKTDILPEWSSFMHLLNLRSRDLWLLFYEIEGKRSIKALIKHKRKELIRLGFKPKWIESWLRWVRVNDIKWGMDRGLLVVYFNEDILVTRYLKQGWKRPRLEIHTAYYDEEKGKLIYRYGEVPFITVWRADVGIVKPSPAAIHKFLEDEAQTLRRQAEAIVKGQQDSLTNSYREALWAYENVKARDPSMRKIVRAIKELMKILMDELRTLLEETPEAASLSDYNTRLHTKMKEVSLAGSILLYIMRNEPKILMTIRDNKAGCDPLDVVCKLVCRSSIRRGGFHRRDIMLLFGRIREFMKNVQNSHESPMQM